MRMTSRAAAAACAAGTLVSLLTPLVPAGADTVKATVVQSILTSKFNPPSPDPSGITYIPSSGRLLIVDSEVEEMSIYRSVDLWETSLSGSVARTGDVTRISKEPTGVAFDPSDGTLYISDDDSFRISAVKAGSDGRFGTSDDTSSFFDARAVGDTDPEGVTVDTLTGDLYLAGGTTKAFYRIERGADGRFGTSDDVKGKFDVGKYGLRDMEGIAFDAARKSVVAFDTGSKRLYELDRSGNLLRIIDMSAISPKGGGDVAVAPSSSGQGTSYWVVLRGVDNNSDPSENDGKLFELSVTGTPPPPPPPDPGTVKSFVPVADASLYLDSPTTNFGTAQTLETDNSPVKRYLLKFEVSGVTGQTVSSITLRLTCTNASAKGGDFRPTSTTTWVESGPGGVTWNTQPAFDAGASPLASLGSVAAGTTYDVTLPASYVTSDGTYSLVVSSTSSDGADFWSREKGGSLVPQLVVTVS
jgi:SdiA-regulated protein